MDEQRQRGMRSPYFLPAVISQPTENTGGFTVETAIAGLSISKEFDDHRHRQMTPFIGSLPGVADLSAGSRLDPWIEYQLLGLEAQEGNVEGLMMMQRVARNGYGDFLGFGGAHQDLYVGQAGSWAPAAADLAASSGGGQNLRAVASAQPWLLYRGGEGSLGFKNGERFDHDHDPFLLCKKSLNRNPTPKFPILNISNENVISYPNSNGHVNSSVPRNPEIHQWKQQGALFNLEELRGKIVSFAKHPTGCRILQHNLNFWTNEEIEVVLSEVINFVGYLMKNQSGSYLIQKLFLICSEEQRLRIILAATVTPFELISICLNSFGARAMQKMLEDLSSPQQRFMVMTALIPGAVKLACDTNGLLVISYCLNNFSLEFTERLINEIADKCFEVATNVRGCRVLQLCVETACGEARERLVCQILANAVHLSADPYGNYVVQHLLEQSIPGVEETLLKHLEGKFASLSCNKYSSNVVEKFFVKSGENSSKIIVELITSLNASMLLVDPFANYVIQKALKVATGELFIALVNLILVNASSLQSNKHGRKILAWFDNRK